jgi:hypothetical protein
MPFPGPESVTGESGLRGLSWPGLSRPSQGSPALLTQDGAGLFRPLVA